MAYGHFFRTRSPLKRCRFNARRCGALTCGECPLWVCS